MVNIRSLVKQVLIGKENKRYEKLLSARRRTYEQWLMEGSKDIPRAESSSLEGDMCVFLSSQGRLAEDALQKIAQYFKAHSEVKLLYGDEDILADGVRKCPWFKPDWSPDLLDSCFYFGSVVAVQKELLEQWDSPGVESFAVEKQPHGCGIYQVTDFHAYEKWMHRCVAVAGGYQKGCASIGHIPEVLFHSDSEEQQKNYLQTSEYLQACREELVHDFTKKWSMEAYAPVVSIVIPSKDNPDVLERCIKSCKDAISCEIFVVDNGSSQENRSRIGNIIERQQTSSLPITYLYEPMEFHFSKMCNLGASKAKGSFLLFLNDDVELSMPGTIVQMAALADRSYTGAVGMKLYYPASCKMQHVGITNLPMGPVHKLQFLEDDRSYYHNSNRGLRNVIAVTAACLMVEREKFEAIGGFTTELPVAFNDVDLCFSLYERGYQNVCMNDSYAYHHESLSRGDDESPEKLNRLLSERDKLYRRHPDLEGVDPYYSIHLNREGLDTRIRPAYETAGNGIQQPGDVLESKELKGYRQDNCVLLRVESLREGIVHGYCVVLGDNNACYDKEIILISEENQVYHIPIEGQYRPDLVENMPDQTNVGLCGFWICLPKLPQGSYRIGTAVRNRVTGLCLTNNSNRYLNISERG